MDSEHRKEEIELKPHEIASKTVTPTHTKDWYIKWVSSIILMISLLLTANNLFPYNLFIGVFGFIGWVVVAILWKDRSLILLNTTSLVIYINGIIGYLVDK